MATELRHDLLYVGVDTTGDLAQLIERAFGSDGAWSHGRNVRWYRGKGYDFVVHMAMEPDQGELWVSVDAPTVKEQQQRADITFDRLAAADPNVALTLMSEDDSVVRRRPATRAAQRSTAPF